MRNLAFILSIVLISSLFFLTGIWKRTPWGRKIYKPSTRTPLKENLLRGPGETLRKQITELQDDITFDITIYIFAPFLVLTVFFAMPLEKQTLLDIVLNTSVASIFCIIQIIRIRKKMKGIQNKSIGLNGEIATAQELDQLKYSGYYVFHDFPAEGFNIDHVVIGSSGVYAIETKTRSKPNKKGAESANVAVNGDTLEFPDYKDIESIKQATNQARWLSDFLKKSIGKPIMVQPVVSLPGWYVNRPEKSHKTLVFNPKEVMTIENRKQALNKQTIEQIKHQVGERCRTIEPFKPINW